MSALSEVEPPEPEETAKQYIVQWKQPGSDAWETYSSPMPDVPGAEAVRRAITARAFRYPGINPGVTTRIVVVELPIIEVLP